MKLKQTLFFGATLVFSLFFFVSVSANDLSTVKRDRHATKERHGSGRRALSISSEANIFKHPEFPEKTFQSTSVPVPSASSSTILRRELRKGVSNGFKECAESCTNGSSVAAATSIIEDNCCAGGVSFLKLEFHAPSQMNGTITLGSMDPCVSSLGHKNTKGSRQLKKSSSSSSSSSSSNSELRLVDCNDICVQMPFAGHPCNGYSVMNEKNVVSGSEICIAMVRPTEETKYEYEVAFDTKMDHNLHVLFLSNEGFSVGTIHTSCSKPLTKSWGVEFGVCDLSSGSGKKKYEHINVTNIMDSSTPYLSFVDGISTNYFITASDALKTPNTSPYTHTFAVGLNDCGCACQPSNTTTQEVVFPSIAPSESPTATLSMTPSLPPPSDDPTSPPTFDPSSIPTLNPSSAPTVASSSTTTFSSTPSDTTLVNLSPRSPTGCNPACSAFVLQHCVFIGTTNACDANFQAPVVTGDDQGEGAAAAPLPPSFTEQEFVDGQAAGNVGKGVKGSKSSVKGSKGFGKNGGYGKDSKMSGKSTSLGKGKSEHSRKKGGKSSTSRSSSKLSKGKGLDYYGRHLFSDSEHQLHLAKIEYHKSRIQHLENLLTQIDV